MLIRILIRLRREPVTNTHDITLEIGAELVAAGMVTEVIEGEEVSFVGVPDWRAPEAEEPQEEPEPEDE